MEQRFDNNKFVVNFPAKTATVVFGNRVFDFNLGAPGIDLSDFWESRSHPDTDELFDFNITTVEETNTVSVTVYQLIRNSQTGLYSTDMSKYTSIREGEVIGNINDYL